MNPIEFENSVVARDDGKVTIALFDGAKEPACIVLLECREETARALRRNLSSVLELE